MDSRKRPILNYNMRKNCRYKDINNVSTFYFKLSILVNLSSLSLIISVVIKIIRCFITIFFRSQAPLHFRSCTDCCSDKQIELRFTIQRISMWRYCQLFCREGEKCVNANSFAAILKCLFEHIEWKKGHSLIERCWQFQSPLKTSCTRKLIEIHWIAWSSRYLIYRPCFLGVNKPHWLANQICLSISVVGLVLETSPEDDFTYLWDIYLLFCYKKQILFKWKNFPIRNQATNNVKVDKFNYICGEYFSIRLYTRVHTNYYIGIRINNL